MSFRKEIYLVPYAHLDTQWRWEYPTTIKKYIRRTLEENLRLFEEYPGHRFNFTGTIRYSMMKEYYPELFERVRKLVAEGRWHLAGTCMDETDALVPSVESMIRNVLYGDRWQRREFDRSSRDYMIPDCFGFPANMPTVLAHCGILGFSSQKLAWNSAAGIPFDLGIWLGPDGSGLVSALNPCDYVSRVNAPVQSDRKRVSRLRSQGEKTGIWKSFQYYGVGDIGGAPTEKSVRTALGSIGKTAGEEDGVIVRQGSADDFFSGITADEKKAMERYEGDLLLINHSAGSLTSATIMKRWNRRNEQLAAAAEAAALAALKHAGLPYPAQKIESAWARVIGSQMHDILPGTCTPTAYEYSQNDEVVALKTWTAVLEDTAEAMAPLTAGDGDILLFNPLAEPREDAVSVALRGRDDAATGSVVLVSADGTEYPGQARLERDGSSVVTFAPRQAPFGWSRYSLSAAGSGAPARAPASVLVARRDGEFTLENEHLRVIVSPRGAVRSIVSKALAKEVLGKPLAYELQKEKPALYPAWNMDWRDRKKKPAFRIEDGGEVSVLEEGSERCSLRVRIQHNKSVLIKDISLDRNSDTVEFTERIEWRESGCSLKLAVSTAMDDTTVTYNWETSRIERGLNHSTCFEMPSRLWVEMRDPEWGVSLVEDSKYGFDHPAADTLRMTLIYTPATRALNGFRDQSSQDWGRHTVRYAIHAHRNGWNGTDRLARRFNQPTRAFCISDEAPDRPAGRLAPGQPSLFELSSEQIGVLAAKKAEDGDGILVRLYERRGAEAVGELTFCRPVRSVWLADGLERRLEPVERRGSSFTARVGANAITAYIVELEDPAATPRAGRDGRPVDLDYDRRLSGLNHERGDARIPREQLPARIQSGSAAFALAPEGAGNDAVLAAGQALSLRPGTRRLSLLVASEQDREVTFTWLGEDGAPIGEDTRTIPAMTGFVGQWDTRIWRRRPRHFVGEHRDYAWLNSCAGVAPGFVKRGRLEWYSTHTHEDGEDRAYKFGYLFTLRLRAPAGAASCRLPADPGVYIVAADESKPLCSVTSAQALLDDFDF